MRIAVVILNWNAAEETAACLDHVAAWELDGVGAPAVWVVDNASEQGRIDSSVAARPNVHLLASEVNRGFGGGCNLGIVAALEAGSDAVLLLNNDARIGGVDVDRMAALLADPEIGAVGPLVWHGDVVVSAGGRDIALHGLTHLRPRRPPERPTEVDYVPGSVALIHRRLFERVGLLDEDYFFGGEMADLCRRARSVGLRSVVEPRARATHDLDRSRGPRETLHAYYVVRNRFLYARRHHSSRRAVLFALLSLRATSSALAALARGRPTRARAVTLGLIDGWKGRRGGRNERLLA